MHPANKFGLRQAGIRLLQPGQETAVERLDPSSHAAAWSILVSVYELQLAAVQRFSGLASVHSLAREHALNGPRQLHEWLDLAAANFGCLLLPVAELYQDQANQDSQGGCELGQQSDSLERSNRRFWR